MEVDFAKFADNLAPAIIQDFETGKVLMLGYMNAESFEKTKVENRVTFFSRSRQRLWTKGETSKNYLLVQDILLDCDSDALLIKADPVGPVCHTGADTCFNEKNESNIFLIELEKLIWQRKKEPIEGSYTNKLFDRGISKISQKVGEEAVEVAIAAQHENQDEFKSEVSDLLYHLLVLLAARETKLSHIDSVLKERKK